MSGRFTLACLDMAGTTVEDDGAVEEAFSRALTRAGIGPHTPRRVEAQRYVVETMGQSKADVFAALLDADAAAVATEEFARAYEALVAQGRVHPIDGAEAVLDALRERGIKVCLTTGFAPTTRDALIERLGWKGHIDLALSPADCGRGRPAPDMIFGAMERLGVQSAASVVVVGDTISDLASGRAAGAGLVVGVLSGAHNALTLATVPGTALIADITELISILDQGP